MTDILDEFHAHEALDRASMFSAMWSDHVLAHVYVKSNSDLAKLAAEIDEKLGEFYQAVGLSRAQ